MFKNAVIASLVALLILQHPVYAEDANILLFLSTTAVLFYIVSGIEDVVDRYKAARYRLRRLKKQIENIQLSGKRGAHERTI